MSNPNPQPTNPQASSRKRKKQVNYRKLLDRLVKSIPPLIVDDPRGGTLTVTAPGTLIR